MDHVTPNVTPGPPAIPAELIPAGSRMERFLAELADDPVTAGVAAQVPIVLSLVAPWMDVDKGADVGDQAEDVEADPATAGAALDSHVEALMGHLVSAWERAAL